MMETLAGLGIPGPFLICALLAYLLGSIPFGLVLTRLAGTKDIRTIGSGNIGATNVLRTGRKGLAATTLILDAAKGAVAVIVAGHWNQDMAVIAGGAVVLGHLFPIWLKFRGGKGVATMLGVMLAIAPAVGVIACLVWAATAWISKYSSLAALVAIGASPLFAWPMAYPRPAELILVLALIVIYRHRENIHRLLAGAETQIRLS